MMTKIPRDNLHMSWRTIDGFNKPINVFISPREPGKTDTTWWEKIYSNWVEDSRPWAYLVRQVVEITEAIIQDIEDNIKRSVKIQADPQLAWEDYKIVLE